MPIRQIEEGIDNQDSQGCTALHRAALIGDKDSIIQLASKGANLEILNNNEQTPIMVANANGHDACVNLLLDLIRTRSLQGMTNKVKAFSLKPDIAPPVEACENIGDANPNTLVFKT